jgi:alpha-2-macroglobulin
MIGHQPPTHPTKQAEPHWTLPLAATLTILLVLALAMLLQGQRARIAEWTLEPRGFLVTPEGLEVARLAPVRVTFEKAPPERNPSRLVKLEPEAKGSFTWIGERTLQFQPAFPGLLRGEEYTLTVFAQPEAGLNRQVVHTFRTEGRLAIDTVIPAAGDIEVPPNAQVFVQFNRSVAPLTLLQEQPTGRVLEFDPPLAGRGEWLNTSLYRFIPEALAPNTRYNVRVAAGLTSADDGVLESDYTWSFTTYGPAIDAITPDRNTIFAGPLQPVSLRFNQPMDRASVEGGFRILAPDGNAVKGDFSWNQPSTVVTFTPSERLASQTSYQIIAPRGLRGANGGETKEDATSQFTTVGPPRVSATNPPAGTTNAHRFGVQITFSNPMDPASLDGRVSVSGIPAEEIRENWFGNELALFLNVALQPSTRYTVSIAEGAVDRYGQRLGAFSFSFTTGARPSFISFAVPHSLATYSASTEPILYYHTANLDQAEFRLYRLTDDEANTFLRLNGIHVQPFVPSQPPIRVWTERVEGELNEIVLSSTSLSEGGPLPRGNYYLTSSGDFRSQLVFSVVDTALITKVSHDQLLVWALDLDTGQPVTGYEVSASGALLPWASGRTDDIGIVAFPVAHVVESGPFVDRSFVVTASTDGRYGVASTRWNQGMEPYRLSNVPVEFYPRQYVGHVYTERPIYRPGEEVHFKGVVRLDDDANYRIPDGPVPVWLVVLDSQRNELYREQVSLNEFGTFAGSMRLPDLAHTGDYGIELRHEREQFFRLDVAGSVFLVAEFRTPEFQVEVEAPKASYVNGEMITASALATFFFGGAVENAPVQWSVMSTPYFVSVRGFERYSFADYDYFRQMVARDVIRARGESVTGDGGLAQFSLAAEIRGDEGPQQYRISASITDDSAQVVAANSTLLVFSAAVQVGVKPTEYLARAGQAAPVDIVTLDLEGQPTAGSNVRLLIYERRWVTTKEETPGGGRLYRSDPLDTLIETVAAVTDARGLATASFTPARSGTIRVVAEVTDSSGRTARAATYIWVSGTDYPAWRVTNDDTIELVADSPSYRVGDVAEVLVPTPYAGAIGLVTVERGKVITRSIQSFPTNSERLLIPITEASVPNVFVTVVLYRAPTEEDPVPRFKVGYVKLPVSTETRELNVTVQPDRAQAQPGDLVRYDIRVTDSQGRGVPAELSVAVVDKAVLSLAEERGPNGLRAFWYERGLGVHTSSSLAVSIDRSNDVIAEAREGGKGGGGLSAQRLRQDFQNTAYWEAQLATDANGYASVQVKMPDNLTTWRLQARAVSGDTKVGEAVNELLSTQPLLLRPALPRFLRVGDEATLRLLITNATDQAVQVQASLEAVGLTLSDRSTRSTNIPARATRIVEWPASASVEGDVTLTFRATANNGHSDQVLLELPVYLDITPETMATNGIVRNEPMFEAIYLPDYAITSHGSLSLSVQASLIGSLAGELRHFRPVLMEPVDRIANRLTATLAVNRAEASAGSAPTSSGQIQADIASLTRLQRSTGGWSWCELCEVDPHVTAMALTALGEAARDGFSIDPGVFTRARGYVFSYINRQADVLRPTDPNEKAHLLYALSLLDGAGSVLPQMRSLFEQYRADLANWGRAYLLLGMAEAGRDRTDAQVGQLLNDLAAGAIASANGNHWEDTRNPTHSNLRTTAVVLAALVRLAPDQPLIEETVRWLVVGRGVQAHQTWSERSQALVSLSAYAVMTGELAGRYAFHAELDGREFFEGSFATGDFFEPRETSVDLSKLALGRVTPLAILRDFDQPGRLYYSLNLRYVTPAREIEALNRGFAVWREYSLLQDEDRTVAGASLGDVVRVKLTVVVPADRNYVVLEDLLPAGLEPIDTKLRTTDVTLAARLEAERRDLAAAGQGQATYYAPWFRWYYNPWQQVDVRDDRVVLYAQRLPKGVYEYVYYARATTVGDFFVPPSHIEESYFPEVFGRGDSSRFVIVP